MLGHEYNCFVIIVVKNLKIVLNLYSSHSGLYVCETLKW